MKFLHIEDRTAGPPPGVVEKWTDAANTAVDMGFASLELRAISRLGESFSAMGVAAGEAAEAMRRFAEADVSAASQLSSLGIEGTITGRTRTGRPNILDVIRPQGWHRTRSHSEPPNS